MITKIEVIYSQADIENLLRESAPKEIRSDVGYYWSPKTIIWKTDGSVSIELEKKTQSSYYDR